MKMTLPRFFLVFISVFAALLLSYNALAHDFNWGSDVRFADLPVEAQRTIVLIRQDGPFPYEKDGVTFGNYEKLLPLKKRGYYREFTVKTPYRRGRGARRIIAGGEPRLPREYYYTADHYKSFKLVVE